MSFHRTLLARWRAAPPAARLCVVAVAAAVALATIVWLVARGGGRDSQATAAEAALRAFEKAVRDRDIERLQTLTTEQFLKDYLKLSGPAGIFTGDNPELAIGRAVERRIERVGVAGDTATIDATVRGADARNVDAVIVSLVRRDGAWLVDAMGMRRTSAGGAQIVELAMRDFVFAPEPLTVRPGGTLVLRANNAGAQPHMIGVWKVPPEARLIKVIEATDSLPAGVERIVQSSTFAVRDEGDVIIPGGLRPGRYMLTCFLSDITSPDLTPHYDLGMLTEFAVK